MAVETIIQGILLGLAIAAPIGPTNIEVIRRGLKEGWRTASTFVAGAMVALGFYLLLVVLGLSFLLKSRTFNLLLLFFGVIVLLYLSYNSIKDFFVVRDLNLTGKVDSKKHFVQGIILTISNPAVLLFWTGILGADLAGEASISRGLILSSGIFIGVLIFFIFLIGLLHGGRKYINQEHFRYVSLAAGLVLLFFAIKFGHKFFIAIG